MKTKLSRRPLSLACIVLLLPAFMPLLPFPEARAQSTAFTYEGRLSRGGSAAVTGSYDVRFTLHDAATAGNQIGAPVTVSPVAVNNGQFTAAVDFGAAAFSGADRWLEIAVRPNGEGAFTPLAPRQPVTPAPTTLFARSAGSLSGSLSATQISGTLPAARLPNGLGGTVSSAAGEFAVVSGGYNNAASGRLAAVIGGSANKANAESSFIGGGGGNTISATASVAAIGGGEANSATATYTTIGGGFRNAVSGAHGTVAGGSGNIAEGKGAFIGGGGAVDDTNGPNHASGYLSVIGGGGGNTVRGDAAIVGGGIHNTVSGTWATVGGGYRNVADGDGAFIGGGGPRGPDMVNNHASGAASMIGGGIGNIASKAYTTVGGGGTNAASGIAATVGGGESNTASADWATVSGGYQNTASGQYSFAAGRMAHANTDGSFVWTDGVGNGLLSGGANSVRMRASGGYEFFTNPTSTAGVRLPASGNAWASFSDRNAKKDFADADPAEVLEKLAAIPVQRWRYQWEDGDTPPHLGPMAQDFKAAFYPGRDDTTITTLEFDGVALAAIQGLNRKLEVESKAKDAEIAELSARLERLERLERLFERNRGTEGRRD